MSNIILGAIFLAQSLVWGGVLFFIYSIIRFFAIGEKVKSSVSEIVKYLCIVYLLCVGYITYLLPLSNWKIQNSHSLNIIPFVNEDTSLIVLNFLLFIPMGVFLSLFLYQKKRKILLALLTSIFISFFIEAAQFFFLGRLADIDDVIANTIGMLFGFFISIVFIKLIHKFNFTKKIGLGSLAIIFPVLALLWGFSYNRLSVGDIILSYFNIPAWSDDIIGTAINATGIHYTSLISIALLVLSLIFGICKKENLFAISGVVFSAICLAYFLITLILQYN